MRKAGISIEEGWVVEGKLTIDGAMAATHSLLGIPNRPTAIFCANNEMAMGCIHKIKLSGLQVPVDLSVMGFDDTRYAKILDPPLTTIYQPAEEIGERVMQRLLGEIEEGRSRNAEPEIVPHKLIIRQSVSAPSD
jgi:LacI family repressor for deo operon, udp, cdd, tsx, nupC, and nupG